jgi:hypothetical protein
MDSQNRRPRRLCPKKRGGEKAKSQNDWNAEPFRSHEGPRFAGGGQPRKRIPQTLAALSLFPRAASFSIHTNQRNIA